MGQDLQNLWEGLKDAKLQTTFAYLGGMASTVEVGTAASMYSVSSLSFSQTKYLINGTRTFGAAGLISRAFLDME